MKHIPMGKMTVISGIVSFLIPLVVFFLPNKLAKKFSNKFLLVLPYIYCIIIFFFTIIEKHVQPERIFNLMPFWSYEKFDQADIRWQVYMNVFLFIPFGFLIPFSSKKSFFQTMIIGCCLSVTIESLQYLFALGLCETDDVIHNTLGCIIGYWYCFCLKSISNKVDKQCVRNNTSNK